MKFFLIVAAAIVSGYLDMTILHWTYFPNAGFGIAGALCAQILLIWSYREDKE